MLVAGFGVSITSQSNNEMKTMKARRHGFALAKIANAVDASEPIFKFRGTQNLVKSVSSEHWSRIPENNQDQRDFVGVSDRVNLHQWLSARAVALFSLSAIDQRLGRARSLCRDKAGIHWY